MRGPARDILLLIVGVCIGYVVAVTTRAGSVPFLGPVRIYVQTHPTECFIGLILVGIILYLAGGGRGGGGRR